MHESIHHILDQHSRFLAIRFKNWCLARVFTKTAADTPEDDDGLFDLFMAEERELLDHYTSENPVVFLNNEPKKSKNKNEKTNHHTVISH
jgi:hypothetical protein